MTLPSSSPQQNTPPVECTWGFIRAHHAELSNDCLESLAGIFNGKAEMPDAKYYPLAEQGSWKYEETLRLIEEKKTGSSWQRT